MKCTRIYQPKKLVLAEVGELCKLGDDVSEILERIPPSYKVVRHVRLKMACTKCDVIVR